MAIALFLTERREFPHSKRVSRAKVRILTQEVGQMPQKQVLREHAFTQGLSEAQLERLADISTQVSFRENEVVLVDAARSTSFYFLMTGSVVRSEEHTSELQSL